MNYLSKKNQNQVPENDVSASRVENFNQPEDLGQEILAPITAEHQPNLKPIRRAILCGLSFGIMMVLLIILLAPTIREIGFYLHPRKEIFFNFSKYTAKQQKSLLQKTERKVADLQKRFERLTPNEPYLIIDSSENFIHLKKKNKLIHEGICSTGSYTQLKTADGNEAWIFKTPRGMFRVQGKLEDPVWRMPDWAFVEEGLPIPAANADVRFEYGVLGDYALSLGDGYLIHGTLYQRYLGMPVTHGCVRLGDNELKIVYRSLAIGSKVFIY